MVEQLPEGAAAPGLAGMLPVDAVCTVPEADDALQGSMCYFRQERNMPHFRFKMGIVVWDIIKQTPGFGIRACVKLL